MKRALKFRAKRKETGEFVFGNLFVTHEYKTAYITDDSGNFFMCDPRTIGQFIGKTDATNKEAYEGDIVEDKDKTVAFEIRWNDDHVGFMYYDIWNEQWYEINDLHQMLIIGTVHESLTEIL